MRLKTLIPIILISMCLMIPMSIFPESSTTKLNRQLPDYGNYLDGIENVQIPGDSEPLLLYEEQIMFILGKYGEEVAAKTRKAVLLEKEPVIAELEYENSAYKKENIRLTRQVHGLQVGIGITSGLSVVATAVTIGVIIKR